jgi:hypothetical protein
MPKGPNNPPTAFEYTDANGYPMPSRPIRGLFGYDGTADNTYLTAGQLAGSFPSVAKTKINIVPEGVLESRKETGEFVKPDGVYPYINLSDNYSESSTPGHEVGHAIWDKLPLDQRKQWVHIHKNHIAQSLVDDPSLGSVLDYGADFNSRQSFWSPDPIIAYAHSPAHSFADSMGQYVSDPYGYEHDNPQLYNWFKSVIGREFKERSIREAAVPTNHVPLPGVPEK